MANKIMKSIRFDEYALSRAQKLCNDYNITLTEAVEISIDYMSYFLSLYTVSDSLDPDLKEEFVKDNETTFHRFCRIMGDYQESKARYDKDH